MGNILRLQFKLKRNEVQRIVWCSGSPRDQRVEDTLL